MPATLSPTVMYLRDDRRGNHTHLATQLLQPLFDFSAPFFLVDMPDVVRLIGKNEICHCAGSFHGQCLSGQLSSPPGVGHALGRNNELKRRGRPLEGQSAVRARAILSANRPSGARAELGSGQRLDVYTHIHAEFIFRIAPIAAAQRNSLIGRPGNRHPDQVAISDDPIGRIELNPARARQVNLAPRVGRAASKPYRPVSVGHVDVSCDEPRCEAERPSSFHHKQR